MNLIKNHLKKKFASETDIINQVFAELEEPIIGGDFVYDTTTMLLKKKVINYDMVDMPSGEFGDIVIPAISNDADYKKLKEKALQLFEEKGGTNKQDMIWELEKEIIHGIQDMLIDISEDNV